MVHCESITRLSWYLLDMWGVKVPGSLACSVVSSVGAGCSDSSSLGLSLADCSSAGSGCSGSVVCSPFATSCWVS